MSSLKLCSRKVLFLYPVLNRSWWWAPWNLFIEKFGRSHQSFYPFDEHELRMWLFVLHDTKLIQSMWPQFWDMKKTRLKFAFYCEKFLSYNLKFVGQFEVIVNLSSSWKWTNPRKKRNCCCWWFDKKTTFSVKLFWDIRYFTGKLI